MLVYYQYVTFATKEVVLSTKTNITDSKIEIESFVLESSWAKPVTVESAFNKFFATTELPESFVSVLTVEEGKTYKVPTPPLFAILDSSSMDFYLYILHSDGRISPLYWPHIYSEGRVCFHVGHKQDLVKLIPQGPVSMLEYCINMFFFTRFAYFDCVYTDIPEQLRPEIEYPWTMDDWDEHNGGGEEDVDFSEIGSYQVDTFFKDLSSFTHDDLQRVNNIHCTKSRKDFYVDTARKNWLRTLKINFLY